MLKYWRRNEWRESMRTICRSRSRAKQYESQHELEAKLGKSGRYTKVGSEQPQWVFWGGGGGSNDNTLPPLLCNLSSSSCSLGETQKKECVYWSGRGRESEIASNSVALPPSWSHTVKLCAVQRGFDTNSGHNFRRIDPPSRLDDLFQQRPGLHLKCFRVPVASLKKLFSLLFFLLFRFSFFFFPRH